MKRTMLGLFVIVAMLGMISCESASNPMAPQTSDFSSNAMAKGGNGGGNSNSGETAYTCTSEGEFAGYNETDNPDYGVYEYTLWAGKHNDAGTVTITNDDDNIYVTYNTNETADLGEVHVYLWDDLENIPSKRPAPGHADYVVENINADSYTVVMPADIACGSTFYISTHAALVGNNTDGDEAGSGDNSGETAYSGGADAPDCFDGQKGAWWGYATYTVECFYNISGTVYEDGDNSGDMEAGEDTFSGITVTLYDALGNVVATTTTNADGSYLFEHVPGGADYTVVSGEPSGEYLANENDGGYSISDLSSDVTDVDFGFVPLYDIILNVGVDVAGDCAADLVVTFNGVALLAEADGSYFVENQLPGATYTLTATATSEAGSDSQTWTGMLTADLSLSWSLAVECNGGNNEYDDCDTNQDGVVDAAEAAACDEGPEDPDGEGSEVGTAYMVGNTSFCDDLGQSRWGWANYLEEGDVITQDIYAGAGQCDITKGTLVGQATIDNANGIISITMYGDYYMNDLHLNIGEQLPSNLIANGNFNSNPSSWDPQTYTTSYDVLAGGYVIIHMSVWE